MDSQNFSDGSYYFGSDDSSRFPPPPQFSTFNSMNDSNSQENQSLTYQNPPLSNMSFQEMLQDAAEGTNYIDYSDSIDPQYTNPIQMINGVIHIDPQPQQYPSQAPNLSPMQGPLYNNPIQMANEAFDYDPQLLLQSNQPLNLSAMQALPPQAIQPKLPQVTQPTPRAINQGLTLEEENKSLKEEIRRLHALNNARQESFGNLLSEASTFATNSNDVSVQNAYQNLLHRAAQYGQSAPSIHIDMEATKSQILSQIMGNAATLIEYNRQRLVSGVHPDEQKDHLSSSSAALLPSLAKLAGDLEAAVGALQVQASNMDDQVAHYVGLRKVEESRRVRPEIARRARAWARERGDVEEFVTGLQELFRSVNRTKEEEMKWVGKGLRGPLGELMGAAVEFLGAVVGFVTGVEEAI